MLYNLLITLYMQSSKWKHIFPDLCAIEFRAAYALY